MTAKGDRVIPETELDWDDEDGPEGLLSFVAGAGIGLLVGAAAALSFAPHPGKVTRAELAKALSRLRSCLRKQPVETYWES